MASFHDEPNTSDVNSPSKSQQHPEVPAKVNPLAKHKSKKSIDDYQVPRSNYLGKPQSLTSAHRKSSVSSDEIDVPSGMIDAADVSCSSADKFDNWISDTNQRRSPEGGEDLSQMACAMPEPDQSFDAEKVNSKHIVCVFFFANIFS